LFCYQNNPGNFCPGADLAEAMTSTISDTKKRAAIMGALIHSAKESDMNVLLHCAAAFCNRDAILNILERKADIMVKDSKLCLPLEVAIVNKNSKIF
jgi:hypothetical protein